MERDQELRKGEDIASGEGRGVRRRKCVLWWRMCRSTKNSTKGRVPIRFGTYTIWNGRNGGLESVLRGVSQANMDMGIFKENKATDGVYIRGLDGYSIVTTDAPSRHCGGVAVFYQPAPNFVVEAVQKFGPNIVGFQLATWERRWYIMGCYLAPDNTSMIESIVVALKEQQRGAKLLVAGDFNDKLSETEGDQRGEDVATALATDGRGYMLELFLLRRSSWCWDGRTWGMIREGREVRSWTN